MRIHLTCTNPTRSLVVALNGLRTILLRSGHDVGMSWPEALDDETGMRRLGYNRNALAAADAIIHACGPHEENLPEELRAAMLLGKPVVRFQPGGGEPEARDATVGVSRLEDIPAALARAADATLAS